MAENGQNFFDFGAMPPTPDFVRVRQNGSAYHKPQQSNTENGNQNRPPKVQNSTKHPIQNAQKPLPPQPTNRGAQQKNSGLDLLRMFNLKGLSMDSDRTLILAVIFLLLGDTSDELLLLALLYIMI